MREGFEKLEHDLAYKFVLAYMNCGFGLEVHRGQSTRPSVNCPKWQKGLNNTLKKAFLGYNFPLKFNFFEKLSVESFYSNRNERDFDFLNINKTFNV